MNIKILDDAFLGLVKKLTDKAGKDQTLRIFSEDGSVLLSSFGDGGVMCADVSTMVDQVEPGLIEVDGQSFYKKLKAFNGLANLRLRDDGQKLIIEDGSKKITLSKENDSPKFNLNNKDLDSFVKVNTVDFFDTLARVSTTMADRDVRLYLNGLLLEVEKNKLHMTATDGHRLTTANINTIKGDIAKTIVPRETVQRLLKYYSNVKKSGFDPEIKIQADHEVIRIEHGNVFFINEIIDGRFPDKKRVLPRFVEYPNYIVNIKELQEAVKFVSTCTDKRCGIWFTKDRNGDLIVSSKKNETGEEDEGLEYAQSVVKNKGSYVDTPVEYLNFQYLMSGLKILKNDNVELYIENTTLYIKENNIIFFMSNMYQ